MRLQEFRVRTGASSKDDPSCRDIFYSASFVDEGGNVTHWDQGSLVLDALLNDPNQIPWLIAHALQALMVEADETTKGNGKH
jgi:hypothetical protein